MWVVPDLMFQLSMREYLVAWTGFVRKYVAYQITHQTTVILQRKHGEALSVSTFQMMETLRMYLGPFVTLEGELSGSREVLGRQTLLYRPQSS